MTTKKATHANTEPNTEAQAQGNTQVESPAQQASATTSTDGAVTAVVHAPQTPTPPDEHHGKGGLYDMVNGERVLLQRTEPEQAKA